MDIEKVNTIDELKDLGYFETIRCVLFTKLFMLANHTNGERLMIDIPEGASEVFKEFTDFPQFIKALEQGNDELLINFQNDIVITLIVNSWVVFELIIKGLLKKDYTLCDNDIIDDYHKKIFGLSDSEKKDLDLFYYIRNAIIHNNGAYYANKEIDHVYKGERFFSKGKEGKKITIPDTDIALKMHMDIERLAYKAWENYNRNGMMN